MYHLYKFASSNAATSTEQPAQLVDIVVDPSLQNPDHFPQVECPTTNTDLAHGSNSFSFVLYIKFIKQVFFIFSFLFTFFLGSKYNIMLKLWVRDRDWQYNKVTHMHLTWHLNSSLNTVCSHWQAGSSSPKLV